MITNGTKIWDDVTFFSELIGILIQIWKILNPNVIRVKLLRIRNFATTVQYSSDMASVVAENWKRVAYKHKKMDSHR